jgi:hypothetical protein
MAGRAPHIRFADGRAHVIDERPLLIVFRDRQLQAWEENREESRIAIDHRQRKRRCVEDHDVVRRLEAKLTTEVSAEHRLVRSASGELDASGLDRFGCSALRYAQDEREEQIGHQCRWVALGKEPLEAQSWSL